MPMRNSKNTKSIKNTMIFLFLLTMFISIFGIGTLVFTSWFSSAQQITRNIAGEVNESIYQKIVSFIEVPEHINEVNHIIIENGTLDLNNQEQRDKFFVGVLTAHNKEIYSFSYGTVTGEYYGARRNENGFVEVMVNNDKTQGNSWYYSVNENMTADKLVLEAGLFDPRTRAWYQAAAKTGSSTFSPVYKHFVMDDLSISSAWPLYDTNGMLQGVMGSHMLLSGIGTYLKDNVRDYDGYAIIVEKETGQLIANSMEENNFTVLKDGTVKRYNVNEMQSPDIQRAYLQYRTNSETSFLYQGLHEKFHVNASEISMHGIDWVIISAVPQGLFMADVVKTIHITALIAILALLLSVVIYNAIAGKLLKPIKHLLEVSHALADGNLSRRVQIFRNDEIGSISQSLNSVADKIQHLVNNLEANVQARTEELQNTYMTLEQHKDQLQLILDSTAEGIFGVEPNGTCTFCNVSCVKLLGYSSVQELLGKNMHEQIHHTYKDGRVFPFEECRIFQSINQGKGFEANDEVFWKADGTYFEVEYHAYPQIKNGEVIGGVITFMDITDRKMRENEIQYLSCHDTLTGLHNRRCFEENRIKIDIADNLPLSVIFADINGLKMTNDIFGHAAGDALIQKSAEILMQSCRENDLIARVGGDEFIILLPKTNEKNAQEILLRIRSGFQNARIEAIKCSISLGCETKILMEESLEEILANAENAMYKDKTMNRKSINRGMIDTIVETLYVRSPKEKQHATAVGELSAKIADALKLPETELSKLRRAALLHDIGKIVLDENVLSKRHLSEEELEKMQQHSVVGYRILNLFDDTLDIADYVYSHHERWDGEGYPRGLKGEQIPLLSRIIAIAETYERVLSKHMGTSEESKISARKVIQQGAGTQFDPQISAVFLQVIEK